MTATVITKELLKTLRIDLDKAMADVLAKHGMVASLGSITFTSAAATGKLTLALIVPGAASDTNPQWIMGCTRHGAAFGLFKAEPHPEKYPQLIGRKFLTRGTTYEFMGINQTGHFAIGKNAQGKQYKIKAEELRAAQWV